MSSVCSKAAVRSVVHEDQAELGQQYSQQLALDYDTAQVSAVTDLVRVAPDCNRSYCEDSFSGYSGSV